MSLIYYVEDERDLSQLITKYLQRDGHQVEVFYDGETALRRVTTPPDLWILDIMLTGETNGYDLIKAIKTFHQDTPVIFTSARDQDIDKIMGLELGSDDYLSKPYSPRELVLRVKAVLKRSQVTQATILQYHIYHINESKREVTEQDKRIDLTSKEYNLLLVLVKSQGTAFSRDQLLTLVWGDDYFGSDRVVDDLMRRLRKKMPLLDVETIYGYGYRLR